MSEPSILSSFSSSYAEARAKFLAACEQRSLSVDSRLNPKAKGVNGEALYADIVRIGAADAPKALLLLSGTHGVEGYCGAGVQTALLSEGYFEDLPADVSVIMIHAMNPYGFSHDRRVTEDNVDLNRNFVDFERPNALGTDYSTLHPFLLPSDWDGPAREEADKQIGLYIENQGLPAFQAAVSSGQYDHPDGIFYGGRAPTWSHTMIKSVVSDYLAGKRVAAIIDFHTGLGPSGYGELIVLGSEHNKALSQRWYGDQITDPEAGTSTSAPLTGMVAHGVEETLVTTTQSFVTLEFGTVDVLSVLTAVRADNWLYHKGDLNSDLGASIKRDIKAAFYPETDRWKSQIWSRSAEVVDMALAGLNACD